MNSTDEEGTGMYIQTPTGIEEIQENQVPDIISENIEEICKELDVPFKDQTKDYHEVLMNLNRGRITVSEAYDIYLEKIESMKSLINDIENCLICADIGDNREIIENSYSMIKNWKQK